MFNFTTTNVINTDKDSTGKNLYTAVANKSLNVLRVNNFKKENVESVYKRAYSGPEYAKYTFKINTLKNWKNENPTKGQIFRLNLYINLSEGSKQSYYANDSYFKGRPFHVEFTWEDDAKTTAEKLVDIIKKYELNIYGLKMFDVSYAVDSTNHVVTIEAKDEYQRFAVCQIESLDPEANKGMGEYHKVLEGTKVKAGKEAFGSYAYVLQNLRLPTHARTVPFGMNQDESPILGEQYTQYTIHYCADRGPLGMNAVGQNVKSSTAHVFYVRSGYVTTFEAAIKSAFGNDIIETVA